MKAGAAVAAVVALLAASCSSGGTASGDGATVIVAAPATVADAPLYLGISDGLFRTAGIHLEVRSYQTIQDAVEAMETGHADVVFGDYADVFYSAGGMHKPNLRVVADGYDCAPNVMEVLTLPKDNINSPQDLVGKTVAVPPGEGMRSSSGSGPLPYSEEELATWSVLNNDLVTPSSVTWKSVPTGQAQVDDLYLGTVNAIVATEPTIYTAEQQLGAVPVLDSCSGANTALPLDGYFTDTSYATSQAGTLSAFRGALLKAQAQATSSSASIGGVLTRYTDMDPMTAALVTLGSYPTSSSAANLQRVAQLMSFFGAVPQSQDGALNVAGMFSR